MKTKKAFFILVMCCFLSSCTGNQRARKFGGKEEIQLKPNETVTHLKYFRENSNWGIWEGEIVVK
jgi:hypothetical protein